MNNAHISAILFLSLSYLNILKCAADVKLFMCYVVYVALCIYHILYMVLCMYYDMWLYLLDALHVPLCMNKYMWLYTCNGVFGSLYDMRRYVVLCMQVDTSGHNKQFRYLWYMKPYFQSRAFAYMSRARHISNSMACWGLTICNEYHLQFPWQRKTRRSRAGGRGEAGAEGEESGRCKFQGSSFARHQYIEGNKAI